MAGGESYGGITVPEGDPGALEASAGRLVSTAGLLQSVSGNLNGVIGALSWFGPASAAHATMTGTQNLMATTSADTLIQQASVINGYAEVLQAAQRQAKRAIERAKDADDRIREAKEDIRQAVADQGAAQLRIIAAQAAQARLVTAVLDIALGDASSAAAADAAAAEEAAARRDLLAAEERERRARHRLEVAEDDRREAQQDGLDAETAVDLARTGLIAAAQGAGLLPTQPGGPANPAFAAAAGIVLEQPKPAPEPDDKNWFERRLDDATGAASWTWDQAKQVPGGAWEGTKGIYEGGKFVLELNPMSADNMMHPGRTLERYKQLAGAGQFAYEHPGEFGKQLINYEDLAAGRYGEWAGNLAPDIVLAVTTGGAGTAATRSARMAKATSKLSEAERAFNRATEIQGKMPTTEFRIDKTVAAQAGDQGKISISGEGFDKQGKMLERVGEDSSLLKDADLGADGRRDACERGPHHAAALVGRRSRQAERLVLRHPRRDPAAARRPEGPGWRNQGALLSELRPGYPEPRAQPQTGHRRPLA